LPIQPPTQVSPTTQSFIDVVADRIPHTAVTDAGISDDAVIDVVADRIPDKQSPTKSPTESM